MKEVICICGERVVFLDPEIAIKTCPNCGISVQQHGNGAVELPTFRGRRRNRRVGQRTLIAASAVGLVLLGAAIVGGAVLLKRSAIRGAHEAVQEAEAAENRDELQIAVAAYRRALGTFVRWNAGPEVTRAVQAAIARLDASIAEAAARREAAPPGTRYLPVSLQEVARHAYGSAPESFEAQFERDYAGRVAILRGVVEEGVGGAYKASSLTISYKIFSPSGRQVEISFDGPFFERYRLSQGSDCIVRAVLSRMYLDRGQPGKEGHWVLVLDGKASGLVMDVDLLKGVGWKLDDEIEDLVSAQRSLSPAY